MPIVLAAGYMLRLFQSVMNGPDVPDLPERRDLTWLEGIAIAPLVLGFLWLGVNPGQVVALASGIGASAAQSARRAPAAGAPGSTTSHRPEGSRVVGSR